MWAQLSRKTRILGFDPLEWLMLTAAVLLTLTVALVI
jgi:hypothetical protein